MTESGWKAIIHDQDQYNHYTSQSIFYLRNQCKYLCKKSLERVLEDYERSTLRDCCINAINNINNFESANDLKFVASDNYNQCSLITCPSTIMRWYHNFNHKNNQCMINQYTNFSKKKSPQLLDNNPDTKEAIISYCNNNLGDLTSYTLQDFIINTCLPQILQKRKEEMNNPHLDIEFVMKENNIKQLCRQTVSKWLNLLVYKYCECKKSYYCDSHEKPENVQYRYAYIDRYLKRELKCYRQIQLSEEKYLEMLEEGAVFLGHYMNIRMIRMRIFLNFMLMIVSNLHVGHLGLTVIQLDLEVACQ